MKILLYSYVFSPNLGGIETVSLRLAESWLRMGHEVTVVTETLGRPGLSYPYPVVRRPSRRERLKLARAHDLVYSNGPSVRFAPFAWLAGKPFCWTLVAYQIQCLDGMGVVDGQPAPRTPWKSFLYHARRFGWIKALKGGAAMLTRRMVSRLAAANIDITHFMARSHPLPRQLVIYNPTYIEDFAARSPEAAWDELSAADTTYFFMGRVSSEKGVETLVRALRRVHEREISRGLPLSTLKIIGDGTDRLRLQALSQELGTEPHIRWVGALPQMEYVREVRRGGVCILPSVTPEPMGVVVLEAMAAGKPLIVSGPSGLAECAGPAALMVPLWDSEKLAMAMERVRDDAALRRRLSMAALEHVKRFDPEHAARLYGEVFESVLKGRNLPVGDLEQPAADRFEGDISFVPARVKRILLYSYAFAPSVGGVETASLLLARGWVKEGREVTVITESPLPVGQQDDYEFEVIRRPRFLRRWQEVQQHDVVHSNGASVRLFYLSKLARKPFSWTHTAHQVQCVDGLGVVDGEIAPIAPWPSVRYHIRRFGLLIGLRGGLILLNRRWIARHVDANVEITYFMSRRHTIPRKTVIYNPFDSIRFQSSDVDGAVDSANRNRHRFLYLGRLSSEKGIDVLLYSFAKLRESLGAEAGTGLRLRIVGEGPYETRLQALASELNLQSQIEWRGSRTGDDLVSEIKDCGVGVIPSITPEPLGIVSLELMAAGKVVIVSDETGLSECVGAAGFAVRRGDIGALAEMMEMVYLNAPQRERVVRLAVERAKEFAPEKSIRQYLNLFESLLPEKSV